jgi:hypothetical protein
MPKWTVYALSAMGVIIMALSTLLVNFVWKDREGLSNQISGLSQTIEVQTKEVKVLFESQNNKLEKIHEANLKQNNVIDKMCFLLSIPYEKRKYLFDGHGNMRDGVPRVMKP